jgi:hypothetical protein
MQLICLEGHCTTVSYVLSASDLEASDLEHVSVRLSQQMDLEAGPAQPQASAEDADSDSQAQADLDVFVGDYRAPNLNFPNPDEGPVLVRLLIGFVCNLNGY